jgi:hypothetical protein
MQANLADKIPTPLAGDVGGLAHASQKSNRAEDNCCLFHSCMEFEGCNHLKPIEHNVNPVILMQLQPCAS